MPMEIFDGPPPSAVTADDPKKKAAAPEHPWQRDFNLARAGKTLSGEPIGEALARPLVNPQSLGDYATGAALTAPLTGGVGAGAGAIAARAGLPKLLQAVAPAAGRLATTFGIGAARGHGTTDTAFGALAESLPLAGRVASKVSLPRVGKLAGPTEAIAEIKRMVGSGPDGPVNLKVFDKLMAWWREAPNEAARHVAGEHMAKALANPDTGLGNKDAAQIFRRFVLRGKVSPETSAKAVAATHPGNAAQAVSTNVMGNTPFGAVAVTAIPDAMKHAYHGIRRHAGDHEGDGW